MMSYSAWPYSRSIKPTPYLKITTSNTQQIKSLLRENSVKLLVVRNYNYTYNNLKDSQNNQTW